MSPEAVLQYETLGAMIALGLLAGAVPVLLPLLIMPRAAGRKARETYECGVDTIGGAWIRFSIGFYLYALLFVAFEVDVLYLIPVAMAYGADAESWRDPIEIALFFLILAMALVFAMRKGVFARS